MEERCPGHCRQVGKSSAEVRVDASNRVVLYQKPRDAPEFLLEFRVFLFLVESRCRLFRLLREVERL